MEFKSTVQVNNKDKKYWGEIYMRQKIIIAFKFKFYNEISKVSSYFQVGDFLFQKTMINAL